MPNEPMMFAPYETPPEAVKHTDLDRRLILADQSWDAGTIAMTLMDIMVANPNETFATLESRMRQLNCKAHLIAVPASQAPKGVMVVGGDGKPRDFWLWVCLHGRIEAKQKLREIGVDSFHSNRQHLEHTGVLAVNKKG
jgi:hypothetical protein